MSDNRTKVRLLQKQVWRKGLVSIRVTKPEGFTFTPGQFVRLGLDIEANGKTEYAARGYSLASVPSDPFLEFFIVEVPNGLVSPRLCALAGDGSLGFLAAGQTSRISKSLVPQHGNRTCSLPQHPSSGICLGKMAYGRPCPFRAVGRRPRLHTADSKNQR